MKSKGLFDSFKHAFEGISAACGRKAERNMRIHMACAFLVLIFGILLKIKPYEWLICILWMTLVITGELINTAIEIAIDLAMPDYHPLAKKAKDVAAGAVLVLAIGAAISGAIIFIPKMVAIVTGCRGL